MELLKSLFENAELPADFKEKTTTLFEAAVDERVKSELASIQESYDNKLGVAREAYIKTSTELLDKVVEETILEWAKENAVGLDSQVKAQIAESFLAGLKGIFEKADIELSGDTAGKVLVGLQEQNATLIKAASDTQAALVVAESKLVAIKRKDIMEQLTVGLADTQKFRIAKLCEAFDFKSEQDFREKAAMVLEAVAGIKGTTNADGTILAISGTESQVSNKVDPGASNSEDGKLVDKPAGNSVGHIVDTNNSTSAPSAEPTVDTGAKSKERADYDRMAEQHAPHLHSDLVAETLKLYAKRK
jgi:hypothetical protein